MNLPISDLFLSLQHITYQSSRKQRLKAIEAPCRSAFASRQPLVQATFRVAAASRERQAATAAEDSSTLFELKTNIAAHFSAVYLRVASYKETMRGATRKQASRKLHQLCLVSIETVY